jgi:hypothetical protein
MADSVGEADGTLLAPHVAKRPEEGRAHKTVNLDLGIVPRILRSSTHQQATLRDATPPKVPQQKKTA